MTGSETILVAGASGNLGRRVVEALLRRGATSIAATTRSPSTLAEFAALGVDIRAADYTQPEGLIDAFRGATHMLLISTQAVGPRLQHQLNALKAASEAGVRHIFYTSHSFPDKSVSVVAPEHAAMEKAILASGMTYTILRNFLYSENILMMMAEAIQTGTLFGAAGNGRVAFISRDDCADAAAAAMISASKHENCIYDITGSRAVTYADLTDIASQILGKKINYVNLTPKAFKARMVEQGVPEPHADAFTSFDRANGLGDGDLVTDMVLQLTGHEPESVEDFLAENLHKADPKKTLQDLVRQHGH